jgi:hypothetical protein
MTGLGAFSFVPTRRSIKLVFMLYPLCPCLYTPVCSVFALWMIMELRPSRRKNASVQQPLSMKL